jgi:hypothetical protein
MVWDSDNEYVESLEAVLDAARKTCEANPEAPPLTLLRLAIELHDTKAKMGAPPEDERQLKLGILEGVNRARDEQSTGSMEAHRVDEREDQ